LAVAAIVATSALVSACSAQTPELEQSGETDGPKPSYPLTIATHAPQPVEVVVANETTAVSFVLPVGFVASRVGTREVTYAHSSGARISVAVSPLPGKLGQASVLPVLDSSARRGCYVPNAAADGSFALAQTIEAPCVTSGMRPVLASAAAAASAPVAKADPATVVRHQVVGSVSPGRELVLLDFASSESSPVSGAAASFFSSVRVVPARSLPRVGVPASELPEATKDRGMVPRDACQLVAAADFPASVGTPVASSHPASPFGADSVCEVYAGTASSSAAGVWYPRLSRVVVSSFPFGVAETARRLDQPVFGRVDEVSGMPRLVGTVVRSPSQPGVEALVSVGPQRTLRVAVVGYRGALSSFAESVARSISASVAERVASGALVTPFAPVGPGRSLLGVAWQGSARVSSSTPVCALVPSGVPAGSACRVAGPSGTSVEVRPQVGRSLITAALSSPSGPGSARPEAVTMGLAEGNTLLSMPVAASLRACVVLGETAWADLRITGGTPSSRAAALETTAAELVQKARAL
jgi:hypothetical protein